MFICGYGKRAQAHVTAARSTDAVNVAGAFDPAPVARSKAQRAGLPVFAELEEGLRMTRPELGVVCAPPHVRLELIEYLAGVPSMRAILAEKPLALSLEEARAMYDVCERNNVALVVGHQLRYCREFAALGKAVESGRLGQVVSLRAVCYGKLFDQGSHMVDLIRWAAGGARVEWVDATACDDLSLLGRLKPLSPDFRRDEMHPGAHWTNAVMRLDNGVEAVLSCGVLDRVAEPELGPWLQKRLTVVGVDGVAHAHVASHFSEVTRNGTPVYERTSVGEYESSLAALYGAIQADWGNGWDTLPGKDDNLHTLEVMIAMLESGRRHAPVRVAEVADLTHRAISPVSPMCQGPIVSVILPMKDHRGLSQKAVASWTSAQRCAGSDFELIVITERSTFDLEPQVTPLLRAQDRLVRYDTSNELEQYHHGATLGRGDILLFTEPHVVAEPETIAELLKFFRTEKADGACGRTSPICSNAMAAAESSMYEEGFVEWSKPGAWQKAIIRAFAMRRQVYFDVGGFDYRYDRFAEWLLAATLHRNGYLLAYAPGVTVGHLYGDNFPLFDRFIKEFTDGECEFRLRSDDPEFCLQYFGAPQEWAEARSLNAAVTRLCLRNLLGLLLWPRKAARNLRGYVSIVLQILRTLPVALLGGRLLLLRWHSRIIRAKLRFWLAFGNKEQRDRGFADYYSHTTSLCRVRYALAAGASRQPSSAAQWKVSTLADMPEGELTGFYPCETFEGKRFHWSSSLSAVRLRIKPGYYCVRLQMLGVRKIDPNREAAFFINSRLVKDVRLDNFGREISLEIGPQHFGSDNSTWLVIFARPWRIAQREGSDARLLGLPICEIAISDVKP
jgi:predicted dehydrogenase